MGKELKTIDKLRLHLFDSKTVAEVYLSVPELEVKKRIEAVFAQLIEEPTKTQKELRNELITMFGISIAQAYRDMALAMALWGNFQKASKEYFRYKVVAMLEEAYEKAKTDKNPVAMVMAADKIGKYTRLDQDDIDQVNWDEVFQPPWEPTNDVSTIGLPPISEKKRDALRSKYMKEVTVDVNGVKETVYTEDDGA